MLKFSWATKNVWSGLLLIQCMIHIRTHLERAHYLWGGYHHPNGSYSSSTNKYQFTVQSFKNQFLCLYTFKNSLLVWCGWCDRHGRGNAQLGPRRTAQTLLMRLVVLVMVGMWLPCRSDVECLRVHKNVININICIKIIYRAQFWQYNKILRNLMLNLPVNYINFNKNSFF